MELSDGHPIWDYLADLETSAHLEAEISDLHQKIGEGIIYRRKRVDGISWAGGGIQVGRHHFGSALTRLLICLSQALYICGLIHPGCG